MFQVAVAGPPLTQDPNVQLITDSLRDFLHPDETEIQLLVPIVGGSLTRAVQAVVEWSWEKEIRVTAIYREGVGLTDVECQLLEDADESIYSLDAAQTVTHLLVQALPNACLIVAPFGEEYDDFTRTLMTSCFENGVPVYDLSNALMEVDPYDSWENEGGAPEEEEEDKPQETAEETVGEPQAPSEEEYPTLVFAELDVIEHQADRIGKAAVDIRDRARALRAGRPMRTQEPRRHGIEISYDNRETWHPRKRGRAPGGSVERDAVTKEILRQH